MNQKLEEFILNNDFSNEIIISLIFHILKKTYYTAGKEKNKSSKTVDLLLNQTGLKKNISSPNLSTNKIEIPEIEKEIEISENVKIIEHSLNLAINFLTLANKEDLNNINFKSDEESSSFNIDLDSNTIFKKNKKKEEINFKKDDISICTLNFLIKFMEDPIFYVIDPVNSKTVNNFFFISRPKFIYLNIFSKINFITLSYGVYIFSHHIKTV